MSASLVACGGGAPACPRNVTAALERAVGSRAGSARLLERDAGTEKCAYASGAARIDVSVDGLPQAYRRWADSEVERSQNTAGWQTAPAEQPQQVDGIGLGAYWVRAERTLYATDGRRLMILTVRAPQAGDGEAIARAVAPAALRAPLPPGSAAQ